VKEKELRLALVCYGGVSLAVYQHGVTKEILKLVRASKAYHSAQSTVEKQSAAYTYATVAGGDPDASTEIDYFDLLKAVGAGVDLRVLVDVVAGSSAGGLNSVTLARALAHDLSLEPLTAMWMEQADMRRLLAPDARAHAWSKWYFRPVMTPLLWGLSREGLIPSGLDRETRQSLSLFLRSRWFKPPLDGRRLTNVLLDALQAMSTERRGMASLLPDGQRLDLLVTATDFHGSERSIFIHDPPVVREREHRHLFRFVYERPAGGLAMSDFGEGSLPSLAFAGRATAAYPGAFPPVQLAEMDSVLAERGELWPMRQRFLDVNFSNYREDGLDPAKAVLLDGSILDNKPIFAAIATFRTHRAFREVDRRLVYVDPHSKRRRARRDDPPGFFRTLRGALSDLPRQEPIYQELVDLDALNEQVVRIRSALTAARPQVAALVERMTRGRLRGKVRPEDLRRWRLQSGNVLATTGLSYNAWITLMLADAIDFIAGLTARVCDHPPSSPEARWIRALVAAWASERGIYADTYVVPPEVETEAQMPPFGAFIVNFGVSYRRRRLTFVVQAVNDLYVRASEPAFAEVSSAALDLLKRRLYRCLDALRVYEGTEFLSAELIGRMRGLFAGSTEAEPPGRTAPETFLETHRTELNQLFDLLSRDCDLVGVQEEVDAVLASPAVYALGPEARHEVLLAYIGFVLWDVVLLPMGLGLSLDAGTLNTVLVDRVSPEDSTTIRLEGEPATLMGGSFAGFGGFLSRTVRENDYLWGRLNAVDRLIDIVVSSVATDVPIGSIDTTAFKKRAFQRILDAEAGRLERVDDLLGRLRAAVERL
jgi:patatin-related protein